MATPLSGPFRCLRRPRFQLSSAHRCALCTGVACRRPLCLGSGLPFSPNSPQTPPTSRPLRIEFPDAIHHDTARGDGREPIYRDDTDVQRGQAVNCGFQVRVPGLPLHLRQDAARGLPASAQNAQRPHANEAAGHRGEAATAHACRHSNKGSGCGRWSAVKTRLLCDPRGAHELQGVSGIADDTSRTFGGARHGGAVGRAR